MVRVQLYWEGKILYWYGGQGPKHRVQITSSTELPITWAFLPQGIPRNSRVYFDPKMESMKGPCQRPVYVMIHNKWNQTVLTEKYLLCGGQLPKPNFIFLCPGVHLCITHIPATSWKSSNGRLHVCSMTVDLTWSNWSAKTNLWLEPNISILPTPLGFSTDKFQVT